MVLAVELDPIATSVASAAVLPEPLPRPEVRVETPVSVGPIRGPASQPRDTSSYPRLRIDAGVGVDLGTLAGPGVHAQADVGVGWKRLRLAVGPRFSIAPPSTGTPRASFWFLAGALTACPTLRRGRGELDACGGLEFGNLHGETDDVVAAKFKAAQSAGLIPIVCVGETLEQRESGATRAVVERQVTAVLEAAGVRAFAKAVVAYEPVWAIGTGRTATPEQAQEVHALIRGIIAARDATIAAGLSILYGGSVKGGNARSLLAMVDIDGGLVGGASLSAAEFLEIFRAAA